MNYGPLTQAIDKLIETALDQEREKIRRGTSQYAYNMEGAWRGTFEAVDTLIQEVKEGRIGQGD